MKYNYLHQYIIFYLFIRMVSYISLQKALGVIHKGRPHKGVGGVSSGRVRGLKGKCGRPQKIFKIVKMKKFIGKKV